MVTPPEGGKGGLQRRWAGRNQAAFGGAWQQGATVEFMRGGWAAETQSREAHSLIIHSFIHPAKHSLGSDCIGLGSGDTEMGEKQSVISRYLSQAERWQHYHFHCGRLARFSGYQLR